MNPNNLGKLASALTLITALSLLFAPASAHDINITGVARVLMDAYPGQEYRLSIADQQVPPLFNIERVLPERCVGLDPGRYSYRFRCQPELNSDDRLIFPWGFEGLVIAVKWSDGSNYSGFFPGDGSQIEVPLSDLQAGAGSAMGLALNYLKLGVEHILFGLDHLLFVLGLLLLHRKTKTLILTVTAFTVSHSITLALATLKLFPLPGPPIEALIALSILFLAREVILGKRGEYSLVHDKPWLVAFSFGLIHGFGFAGALAELGLAAKDIPLALLAFNVGVEAGQLAFILAVLALLNGMRLGFGKKVVGAEIAAAYGIGGIALFWFVERLHSGIFI
jgi:hydrogenase/urease accessory protein HupE